MKIIIHRISFHQHVLLLLALLFTGSFTPLAAQTDTETNDAAEAPAPKTTKYKVKKNLFNYNNIISVYPFQPIINYMTLGYEFKTGDKTAFKTIAGYARKESNDLGIDDMTDYSAYRVEMQFKIFTRKKPHVFNGTYIAPFVLYKNCNYTSERLQTYYDPVLGYYTSRTIREKGNASVVHAGFILGYHAKIGENFTIDMYAGEGIMSASGSYKNASRLFDVFSNEIRMKIGLSVGYGF
jgi:hypothetical protein